MITKEEYVTLLSFIPNDDKYKELSVKIASRALTGEDDSTFDCTDLAHPAYWRGEDAGMKGTIKLVKEAIYNGMKELPLKGTVSNQEFQALRLELYNHFLKIKEM